MSLAVSIDPIFWLLCAIGFVVLEAMTWNLVSIWFAVGSAAALLSCLLVQSFRVQAAVFIAVSALCLLALLSHLADETTSGFHAVPTTSKP